MNITPEVLAAVSGAVLSLVFSYVPGLNSTFDRLTPTAKRLTMAAILLLVSIGTAFWACTSPGATTRFTTCLGGTDWRSVLTTYIYALMANQATHQISPDTSKSDPYVIPRSTTTPPSVLK